MNLCKKKMLYILVIVLICMIGITYAWLMNVIKSNKTNTVTVGTLNLNLKEEENTNIYLEKAEPIVDSEGLEKAPYKFTIENIGNVDSKFILYLDNATLDENESLMEDKYVKYNLVKNNKSTTGLITALGFHPYRVLDIGEIKIGEKNDYELRLWIDSNATNEVLNKVFKAKVRLEAVQLEID